MHTLGRKPDDAVVSKEVVQEGLDVLQGLWTSQVQEKHSDLLLRLKLSGGRRSGPWPLGCRRFGSCHIRAILLGGAMHLKPAAGGLALTLTCSLPVVACKCVSCCLGH